MAKRSNPYSEDFTPQLKQHIGLKQFNNTEERMQKVYEKTLELLFRGAKKKHTPIQHDRAIECVDSIVNNRMKQLSFTRDGLLEFNANLPVKPAILEISCSCGNINRWKCNYCELPICSQCERSCAVCLRQYCTTCCLHRYENVGDVCTSCLK